MSMSCALRKPGFYPAVMKPSVATCHPWLQDSQLPSSFTWLWHRLCCRRFARSLTLRHRRLQLSTFFVRTVSADFLLISTLTAHLLSLPSSSESEKQLKDSLFMEQFPDLLEYNNSPKGCSLIVGDFKFHNDVPTNTYTSRLIDLLESFNLCHSVTTPTHRSGHILDWVIHRKDDDTLLSTTTSPSLQSDYYSVLTQLNIFKPPPHAVCIEARNIAAIDLSSFRSALQAGLDSCTTLSAVQPHRLLQSLLNQHAPATQRKVSSRPPSPFSVPSVLSFSRPSARGGERRDSG